VHDEPSSVRRVYGDIQFDPKRSDVGRLAVRTTAGTRSSHAAYDAVDQLEALVVVAAREVRSAFDRGLVELDLNMSEAGALANLAVHGPLTQTELARRLHIGRASAGTVVDALESRGLVRRVADPDDRRVWRITLSADGERMAARFDDRHAEIRDALHVGISARDRKLLAELLRQLIDNATRLES
jgi:MarR family transcriptional regulator for hemolysin